jgi:mono/diheme cytochrome c family protein
MRTFAIISFFGLLIWACSGSQKADTAEAKPKSASELYKAQCSICHGKDGRKGIAGAGILPESKLSMEERIALITYGKGNMMAYEGILTKTEIAAIAAFTTTLK